MQDMFSYTMAAIERTMKVQEVILHGASQEDCLVASGRDQGSATAARDTAAHRWQRAAARQFCESLTGFAGP
jgi:hypothetical protein